MERWLHAAYVVAEGASLRQEDRRKAAQVAAMLEEIRQALSHVRRSDPITLVDAAAGKSYVALLAAKLVFEAEGRAASIVILERDRGRVDASRAAAGRLELRTRIEWHACDVAAREAWPDRPTLVVALHACGPAADAVIDAAGAARARHLLLVPCCTGRAVRMARAATARADEWGMPRQAGVRRRFVQALVDAERTWRLEAAGYETEVVELVAPTITPHNLLWRGRLVSEPRRMAKARQALAGPLFASLRAPVLHSSGSPALGNPI